MKRNLFSISALGLLTLLLAGCSETSAPAKKAETKKLPAEPASGLSGISQTFLVARTWAPDLALVRLENLDIAEAKAQPGKYGAWRATYVSPSKKIKREYVYSVADSEGGIFKGARAGAESMYAKNPQIFFFPIQDVRIDTTAALAAALKEVDKDKDMKKVLDANKDLPVQYLLEWTGNNTHPTWRVIWGANIATSKFSIFIDANDGKFIRKLR